MRVIKKFVSKLMGGAKPAAKPAAKTEAGSKNGAKSRSASGKSRTNSNKNNKSRQASEESAKAKSNRQDGGDSKKNRGEQRPARNKSGSAKKRSGKPKRDQQSRQKTVTEDKGASPSTDQSNRVNARTSRVARPASANRKKNTAREPRSASERPGGGYSSDERAKLTEEHSRWALDSFQVEPAEGKKRFHDFDLPSEIMHAVADLNFQYCTPIQALSLEFALAGKNVAGKAQTGTGKTAAFLIAILTRYLRSPESKHAKSGAPRALVIAPTRELVIQICKDAALLGKYCNLRTLAIFGGMDYNKQRDEVQAEPIDLLVATPGRLLDYARRRIIDLSQVDTLVIDEADRMLDMGFIPDVRLIMNRLPRKDQRCTMLYSATLSQDVMRLAAQWMDTPEHVEIDPESVATDTVNQIVYVVTASEKFTVLYNLIQRYRDKRMLVFCNRKSTTESVVRNLKRYNIDCDMLSGDVNQNRRLRVLDDFRAGKSSIVIATDVAGRGIHVDDLGFVVNYDFPYEAEDYVHRIGRTGRAGQEGTAISFADEDESFIIPDIEKYIGEPLKCTMLLGTDPLMADLPTASAPPVHEDRRSQRSGSRRAPRSDSRSNTRSSRRPDSRKRDSQAPRQAGDKQSRKPPAENTSKSAAVAAQTRVESAPAAPPLSNSAPKSAEPAGRRAMTKDEAPAKPAPAVQRKQRFSDEWVPGE